MRLKTDNPETENSESEEIGDHTITTRTAKVMYTEAMCLRCFGHGLASLLNLGDTFAEYASVVSGIDGIEAIIIPQAIFDVIELPEKPENCLDDMLTHLQADPEADLLHIIVSNFDTRERAVLSALIKTYFAFGDNGFKPSESTLKTPLDTDTADLPAAVRTILDNIIKQSKGKH